MGAAVLAAVVPCRDTMTILREQITADVTDVFLEVDDFAEDVTYIPASGASRTVRCVVEKEQEYFDTDHSTEELERIRVFVPRTEDGILSPVVGDGIRRSASVDSTDTYGYSRMIEMPEDSTHWLLFTRKRQAQFVVAQKGARP